jgi:hypothetical protein
MMAPVDFDKLFAHLREKRAVSAAKRFISRGMRFSQRPERLSTEDTNRLAFEAIAGWLNSRANRFSRVERPRQGYPTKNLCIVWL